MMKARDSFVPLAEVGDAGNERQVITVYRLYRLKFSPAACALQFRISNGREWRTQNHSALSRWRILAAVGVAHRDAEALGVAGGAVRHLAPAAYQDCSPRCRVEDANPAPTACP
jgi:hypothetical protein